MILQSALVIAMVCQFIHATTWKDMILGKFRLYISQMHPIVLKALFDCPICMVPYYGFLCFKTFPKEFTTNFFLTLLVAGGINATLVYLKKEKSNERTNI